MEINGLKSKAIKSGYSFVSSSILVSLIGALVVPIYMIYLTPAEYGIVSLFISTVTLLVPILSLSGDAILARLYFFNNKSDINRARIMGALIGSTILNCLLMSGLLLLIFNHLIDFFYQASDILEYKFLILGCANSIVFIKLYERLLKSMQDVLLNPALKISRTLVQITISLILLIYLDLNFKSLVFGFSIASILIGLISILGFIKNFKPNVDLEPLKIIYRFTLPLIPNRLSAYAINPSMNFLIFSFLNLTLVGIYNVAYLVMNIMLMIFQKINEAFQPWIYQSLFQMKPNYIEIKYSIRLLFVSLVLITIIGLILGPFLLENLFPKYFENQTSFIRVLLIFPFVNASKSLAVSLLMKKDSGGYYISFGTYLFIILLFTFGFYLIPNYGLFGAAFTLVISRYLSSELTIFFLLRDKNMQLISNFSSNRKIIILLLCLCCIDYIFKYVVNFEIEIIINLFLITFLIILLSINKEEIKNIKDSLLFRSKK